MCSKKNYFYFYRYVLGVESPLVCDIMHLADENGVMDIAEETFEQARE